MCMLIVCVCLLYVYAYCMCMLIGSASSMEALSTPNDATHTYISATSSTFDMGAVTSVESIIILPRSELDRANKDKRHYPEDFQVNATTIIRVVAIIRVVTIIIHMLSR